MITPENNASMETNELYIHDGSDIVETAKAENSKGYTRRQFLTLAGTSILSALVTSASRKFGFNYEESANPKSVPSNSEIVTGEFLNPEFLHDVEVYGLTEKITTPDHISILYNYFDKQYSLNNNVHVKSTFEEKIEQKSELLDPNERYLEVVVTQAAYNSFQKRIWETNIDFVEWIKMHVDTMNLCVENSQPSSDMKAVLRRIIVIDNDLPDSFWDEKKFRIGQSQALDVAYRDRFAAQLPIDTDCTWAIADDYRPSMLITNSQGYFWGVKDNGDSLIFRYPPGGNQIEEEYKYPKTDRPTSLDKKNDILIDCGLTHEWSHYLWGLPDEYVQDVNDSKQNYPHFIFDTGYFQKPYLSPYLSYLAQENIRLKKRWYLGKEFFVYRDWPEDITFEVNNKYEVLNYEVRRVQGNEYKDKYFSIEPQQEGHGNTIHYGDALKEDKKCNTWLIDCTLSDMRKRSLYIPVAAFKMSHIAGKVDSAKYNIEFTGYTNPDMDTQIVELIDQKDIDEYLNKKHLSGDPCYAKMRIDGTSTWLVWFLRSTEKANLGKQQFHQNS